MSKTPVNAPQKASRYRGDRRPTTVVLSDPLVKLAQEFFPKTNHGSLSAFLESTLTSHLRRSAGRMRKLGIRVPEALFTK